LNGATDSAAKRLVVPPECLDFQKTLLSIPLIDTSRHSKTFSRNQPTQPLPVVSASSVAANDPAVDIGHGYLLNCSEPTLGEG
jgi:hypothetical protein